MNAAAITVVARWQPAPDALGEVLELCAQMRRQSLEEPGCLGYEAYQSLDEPRSVLLVERYRDEAALEAHKQSAHYRALVVERVLPLLAERKVDILRAHAPL
ncbi:putative quinol monooxygenase [Herbaspirillum robiniae]|uniref:Antibiotic biosynthesis monooxygenase n=1 Tax=Herbaspirillum robiniae TaxID=2014887 RepID=A0ABX2LXG5_9BURK|nr:putative quinol monooxygenase [Herbaspirillum robiniae]NUU01968.1 antibiotic biosynthesis monooxygenase [Herbaspirillum robiniae]